MRFAYQCAWARTLLDDQKEYLIEILSNGSTGSEYSISITFPQPLSESEPDVEKIPYFEEWKRQMNHYRGGKVFPWHVTDKVTPLVGERLKIELRAKA